LASSAPVTGTPSRVNEPAARRNLSRGITFSIYACAGTIIFSIAIAQAAALLALLLWLVKVVTTRNYPFSRSPVQIPFAVFVAIRILSIPLSTIPSVSIDALRTEIFFYGLFFVVLNEFDATNLKALRNLILILFASAALAAVIGSIKQLTGIAPRAVSTASGYYTLGMFLCTILALAFPLGSRGVIITPKWVWLSGSLLMLLGLLLTFNRLHWVAAGLAVFIGGALYERRLLAVFIAAGIAAVLFIPEVGARFQLLLQIGSNMSDRDIIWKGAMQIWDQHPVTGFGLRTFRDIFPLFDQVQDKGISSWHNDFLQVYMESGAIGLAAFISLFAVMLVTGFRSVRLMAKDHPLRIALASLLLTMIPFMVAGFILDALIHLLFFLVAGVLARLAEPIKIPSASNQTAPSNV